MPAEPIAEQVAGEEPWARSNRNIRATTSYTFSIGDSAWLLPIGDGVCGSSRSLWQTKIAAAF
jgi:hypothetical protein